MLTIPVDAWRLANITGIDPGSDTLGVASLSIDLTTMALVAWHAQTFKGAQAGRHSWATEIHGERYGRIESHRQALVTYFLEHEPFAVVSEAPFINRRRPQAYGALTEVVSAIRGALAEYDSWKRLRMIDPPTVKAAVGVSGKTGGPEGKALMQKAVMAHGLLSSTYVGVVPIEKLDEHAIDATAVAYTHYLAILEHLCLPLPALPFSQPLSLSSPGSGSSGRAARKKTKRSSRRTRPRV